MAVLAWLVALTVTVVFEVTVGAVNSPDVEIDPALADHVTAVFVEPLTDAVNCWVPPEVTVVLEGEIATDAAPEAVTATVADADLLVSASLVTVIVAVVSEPLAGAVYTPAAETEPVVAVHVTA